MLRLDITLEACYVWTLLYRHVTFRHYFKGMLRLDITLQACYVRTLLYSHVTFGHCFTGMLRLGIILHLKCTCTQLLYQIPPETKPRYVYKSDTNYFRNKTAKVTLSIAQFPKVGGQPMFI
jgi:hypothetical protein